MHPRWKRWGRLAALAVAACSGHQSTVMVGFPKGDVPTLGDADAKCPLAQEGERALLDVSVSATVPLTNLHWRVSSERGDIPIGEPRPSRSETTGATTRTRYSIPLGVLPLDVRSLTVSLSVAGRGGSESSATCSLAR